MIKVSDYIVEFLVEQGVEHVFGYPGGMITHFMESLSKCGLIQTHLCYHEQAAAFEAVGYSKVSNKPTVVFTSSGPGATNLLTGISDAWLDSTPVIFITGNVNTYESKKSFLVRQKGFQELNITNIVSSVTKYCTYLEVPTNVKYELQKSFFLANSGRKGPCLIDIPMDISRQMIDENNLEEYLGSAILQNCLIDCNIFQMLSSSQRPVVIIGNGIHISGSENEVASIIKKWKVPVVSSLLAVDMLYYFGDYSFGFIGAYGSRVANIILDKADLVISIGSRLDNRQIGNDRLRFSSNAKLIRLDIDANELDLKVKDDEIDIICDIKSFCDSYDCDNGSFDFSDWLKVCDDIRNRLSSFDGNMQVHFLKDLLSSFREDGTIVVDVGQNQIWVPQALSVNMKTRMIFSGGLGAMGFSLPAAIGASLATNSVVYSFSGDGGFQMNIQELQFVKRENLNIKFFILNNHSLGMIRHFQELYFEGNEFLTTEKGGYIAPDFVKVGEAYGIPSKRFTLGDLRDIVKFSCENSPCIIDIDVGTKTYVEPKSVYNRPLSYQLPPLPLEEYEYIMKL